jgi:hypothetical protein
MHEQEVIMIKKPSRVRVIVTFVLGIIALAVIVFSVVTLLKKKDNSVSPPLITEVIKDLKLNTITYYYTDLIFLEEEEEWKIFGLIDLDPGVRYLGVQYNGIIRIGIDLGVDAQNLVIEEKTGVNLESGKRILEITLPNATEISHEQLRNEEKTVIQDGKFTKTEVSREMLNEVYEERKEHNSETARSLGLYEQAKESAIEQITSLLNLIPSIQENYIIEWK